MTGDRSSPRDAWADASGVDSPYLSIVATARNDDHGGDLLRRVQLFTRGVIAQCNAHGIDAELLLVEWNPPLDRPRLAEAVEWPAQMGRCTVRVIEVPHDVHARLRHSERLPLFQMIAKNVGIRRAKGTYVLATNVDILFPEDLMAYIAKRPLEPGFIYRVDRCDVDPSVSRLEECERNVIRISRRDGTLDLRNGTFYRIYDSFYYLPWWLGVPLRLVRDGWRGALDAVVLGPIRIVRLVVRSVGQGMRLARIAPVARPTRRAQRLLRHLRHPLLKPVRVLAIVAVVGAQATASAATLLRDRVSRRVRSGRLRCRGLLELLEFERARIKLHTNASGDFQLMARDDWHRVRGYAELQMYSMHLDSLLMYTAHWSGVRERVLPYRVYHLEHDGGFKPDPAGSHRLNADLEQRQIQQVTNEQLFTWIIAMARSKLPLSLNRDDWGFANERFVESAFVFERDRVTTNEVEGAQR